MLLMMLSAWAQSHFGGVSSFYAVKKQVPIKKIKYEEPDLA